LDIGLTIPPLAVFLNGENQVKLGDFGLSKQLPAATFASTYVGVRFLFCLRHMRLEEWL